MVIPMRPELASCTTLILLLLAGCSDGSPTDLGGSGRPVIQLDPGTGVVRGVVVDSAIHPLQGAVVTLGVGASAFEPQTTKDDGAFLFTDVPEGTYFLGATHLLHMSAQATVDVVAGDADPPVVKILLERKFSQDPYSMVLQRDGFIQCGYAISGVMSSLCVNDYTHFVGPYTCPECEHLVDRRSADFPVEAGWQTMVFEMTWKASTATSDRMRLVISHFPRTASHWYCAGASESPLLLRMEVGVECEDQQSEPELVPPEGLPNGHLFAAIDGAPVAATVSQAFTVYMHQFYYGSPPEGWSFVAGDTAPF